MDEQRERGKGRARGRARTQDPYSSQGQRPGPSQRASGWERHEGRSGGRDSQRGYEPRESHSRHPPRESQSRYESRDSQRSYESRERGGYESRDSQRGYESRDSQRSYEPREPSRDSSRSYEPREAPPAWGGSRGHEERATPPQGRASFRSGASGDAAGPGMPMDHSGLVGASGDGAPVTHSGSRGAMRGARTITDIVKTRPQQCVTKKGSHGSPINLSANYFKLVQTTNWCLYQYRVDFAPAEDQTPVRKALFRTATRTLFSGYIFDGTVLYTSRRLNPDPTELVVDAEGSDEKIRITIRLVGDVAVGDYHYLQVFNIIMRKCMGFLKLQLVGRNFFDAVAKMAIPEHRMELWPGYVTSIRQHEKDILMCCEITHKVMRNDTVLNLLSECSRDNASQYKSVFTERIIGSVVLTDYNNRTYRIDDVDWNTTPESTFNKADGTAISYMNYYRDRYKIKISSPTQPMLVSRAKLRELRAGMAEIIYLVPELCRMTGLTDAQRANMQLMRNLSQHTRVGPSQRIEKLHRFSQRLREKPEIMKELKQWDLELAQNIVQFSGRVLPQEVILGGSRKEYPAGPGVDWSRAVRGVPAFHASRVRQWVVMYIGRNKNQVQGFVRMLQRAAGGMQWELPQPQPVELRDDRPGSYVDGLKSAISSFDPDLILCVASNQKADRYNVIKKTCCVDRAVPTQVLVARNLDSRNAMSIATKVAIQMNCKLGGAPWTVQIPVSDLMIIGYDACHDPRQKSKSYGAVVATIDSNHSRYFGTFTAHTSGEELSNDFALGILKACAKYREAKGSYPKKFLIYRDGVGDGQIPYVFEHEVEHIKKVLQKEICGDEPLQMCFIIVSKRINTRIFASNGNPQPGTVVDDVITLPERYDFFIVSQCVREGTVSPTSYNVISDTMGLPADKLQRLTYKLTHMYYNWAGAVRVPAPCQYAHKLAFLASQSLQRNPNPQLETVLYYL